ncbi:uncharacterized protein LOC104585461 isoform X2 [Brachypodium distachyon]|uniref:Exocyst subunit Exo70 family protein n=1 Tax=Brachypodium distachyon TaxID=15368 RepID=A0A2K2CJ93_BRADI|nr:uncharacterized protein LOC104585461 isoform X2 [Brachypodium distachyon]PNT62096.1 hypothetical protein BRADI_5g25521v3 [Brachypodium distachyon]PNT62097.1 hypothetical protein BRADI_5g25521v3 [Brachypodium distachyon]|eukprot:XP_014751485.1 uncharacterized protein LOC104585461 isoform X2 [Brachypodium distachyon]
MKHHIQRGCPNPSVRPEPGHCTITQSISCSPSKPLFHCMKSFPKLRSVTSPSMSSRGSGNWCVDPAPGSCTCQSSSSRGSGKYSGVSRHCTSHGFLPASVSSSVVHPSAIMAGHLAAVPEESTNGFTAPHTPRNVYRKLIQGVVASGGHFRSTLFSHSSHNGSSSSSHNGSSYSSQPGSNYSGCSSAMAADVKNREILTADLGAQELTEIAHRMVSDGYTQSMVRAYSGGLDHVLESWFFELDVDWVLRIARARGSWFKDMPAPFQVYSAEMWIRALTIIAASMKEVVVTVHETSAVTRLCKASISAMLVFVDAVVSDIKKKPKALSTRLVSHWREKETG